MEEWRSRAFAARKLVVEALAVTPLVARGIPSETSIDEVCSVAGIEPSLLQQALHVYEGLHYANKRPARVVFVPVSITAQQKADLWSWSRRNGFKPTNLIRSLLVEYLCRPVEPRGALGRRERSSITSRDDWYRKTNVRLTREMHRALTARARTAGCTIAVHVRALLHAFLYGGGVVPRPARSYTIRECQALEPGFLLPAAVRDATDREVSF